MAVEGLEVAFPVGRVGIVFPSGVPSQRLNSICDAPKRPDWFFVVPDPGCIKGLVQYSGVNTSLDYSIDGSRQLRKQQCALYPANLQNVCLADIAADI